MPYLSSHVHSVLSQCLHGADFQESANSVPLTLTEVRLLNEMLSSPSLRHAM